MTTTPEETRMPNDPNHRALLKAVGSLTTQVRRIADTLADGTAQGSFALAPPVGADDDGAQTTGDDAPMTSGAEKQRTIRRQQFRVLLNQLNAAVTPLTTAQVQALTAYVADEIVECNMETQEADRLEAELARIRRALDPDDETYIQETVDDQLAMSAALDRVRKLHEPDDLLCRACATRAPCLTLVALDGSPK